MLSSESTFFCFFLPFVLNFVFCIWNLEIELCWSCSHNNNQFHPNFLFFFLYFKRQNKKKKEKNRMIWIFSTPHIYRNRIFIRQFRCLNTTKTFFSFWSKRSGKKIISGGFSFCSCVLLLFLPIFFSLSHTLRAISNYSGTIRTVSLRVYCFFFVQEQWKFSFIGMSIPRIMSFYIFFFVEKFEKRKKKIKRKTQLQS